MDVKQRWIKNERVFETFKNASKGGKK